VSDPEETAPFTHQPYGSEDPPPFVPPSPAPPTPPPPPSYGGPPYGPPAGQQPWPPGGWAPVYGTPYAGTQDHSGATTALVLGIISIACFVLTFLCCVTLPGLLCAPFAWYLGAKAKRDIERHAGVYGNIGAATAGMWMGAVMTVLSALLVAAFVAVAALIGISDYSLV
jgi:hypothetical protein